MRGPQSYVGNEPYVFISYAHKDAERIYPIIQAMQDSGMRVWYDRGLEVGSHWTENIAKALDQSHCVMCFITKHFLESENCKDEMHFAKEHGKGPLMIYMEDIKLPVEFQLSYGRLHALSINRFTDLGSLIQDIGRSDMVSCCINGSAAKPQSKSLNTPIKPVKAPSDPAPKPAKNKIIPIAAVAVAALVLVLLLIGPGKTDQPQKETPNGSPGQSTEESSTPDTAELLASGTCGTNINWTLTTDGLLTLSGTGKTDDSSYTSIWEEHKNFIKELVVEEGVTSIGESLFAELPVLKKVSLPSSLLSLNSKAFYGCASLKDVTLPENLVTLGGNAFAECVNLASIRVPGSVVTIEHDCFNGCVNLSEVTLEEGLIYIKSSAFQGCSNLASIVIPEGVVEIDHYAFTDCAKLANVTIPKTVMTVGGYAFRGCTKLTSVTIHPNCTHTFMGGDGFPSHVEIKFYE